MQHHSIDLKSLFINIAIATLLTSLSTPHRVWHSLVTHARNGKGGSCFGSTSRIELPTKSFLNDQARKQLAQKLQVACSVACWHARILAQGAMLIFCASGIIAMWHGAVPMRGVDGVYEVQYEDRWHPARLTNLNPDHTVDRRPSMPSFACKLPKLQA